MNDFAGRIAIVVGGAGGIGRAVCERLASRGASIVVADSRADAAEEIASSVRAFGVASLALAVDVTDYEQVRAMVAQSVQQLGHIDVLVNSVGWNVHSFFRDQQPDYWHKVIAINLLSQIYTCHAVLDDMVSQRRGTIVTVASDAGRVGTNGETVYSAAKGGVIALTKSLAREVTRFGIRVNCISPGPTDTPFLTAVTEHQPEIVKRMTDMILMKRIARPDEQAAAIVFLASDDSSYITGQVLSVNGGLNMV